MLQPDSRVPGIKRIRSASSVKSAAFELRTLVPEPLAVDLVFADFVIDDPLGGAEQACGFGAVASSGFEGVEDNIFLIGRHGIAERKRRHRAGRLGGLEGWGQVVSMDHVAVAHEDSAFHDVF